MREKNRQKDGFHCKKNRKKKPEAGRRPERPGITREPREVNCRKTKDCDGEISNKKPKEREKDEIDSRQKLGGR